MSNMQENHSQETQNPDTESPIIVAVPKRDWTSYIKEFIMLFLAVFAGFVAENYRENLSDQQKEKQFIRSYIEDLKVDTTAIHLNLIFQENKKHQLDSLIYFLREQKIKGHENEMYYYGRLLIRTSRFQNSDRTISQLKQSGSMRLIRNEIVTDSIIAYQKLVELILTNIEDERVERRAADHLLASIFNPYVFDDMLDSINKINKPINNPPLRSYDTELQQDLAYRVNLIKGSNIILTTRLNLLKEKAKNIISFLQKEYHLM